MANYNLGEAKGRITIDYDGSWAERAKQGVEEFKKTAESGAVSAKSMFDSVGAWKGIGALATDTGKKLTLGITTPAVAAGLALGAMTIGPGLNRLIAIDNAQAKLKGLGHDATSVQTIMDNALASVKGTAFGLGEAATVAANAVAAGVKPGADLERNLRLVADAATIAGVDMATMGSVFNKVAASNKVQMDVINQLHDAGVPALALLAQQMGVTAEEAQKMASKGEVDFATFQAAMESGLGGAALASGDTFQGAMANMRAAMGRFGAELLSGLMPQIQDAFARIMDAFDKLKPLATVLGDTVGRAFGKILDVVVGLAEWFANLSPEMQETILSAIAIAATVGPALMIVGKAFTLVGAAIAAVTAIKTGYAAATYGLVAANNAERIGVLASNAAMIAKRATLITVTAAQNAAAVATAAWTGMVKGANVAVWLMQPANAAAAASIVAQRTALIAATVAQKAATAAQWLWNAALTANPIGIIIALVAALVAAIIWFFTETELGREILQGFMTWLGEAWDNMVGWLVPIWESLVVAVEIAWQAIQDAIGAVVKWFEKNVWPIIQFVIDMIVAYFTFWYNVVSTVMTAIYNAVKAVVDWWMQHVYPVIEAFVGFIVALFRFFGQVIALVWQTISDLVVGAVTWIVEQVTGYFEMMWAALQLTMQLIRDVIVGAWEAIVAFITPIVEAIVDLVVGAWEWIVSIVSPIIEGFVNWITEHWERFQLAWKILWEMIQKVIDKAWTAIRNFVEPIVKGIVDFITGTWGTITGFVETTFNNVRDAIVKPIEDALAFIGGIKDTIIGFFANAGDWLFNAGRQIIEGFIKGLENMLAEVGNFFKDLTNMIPEVKGPPERDKVLLYDNGRLIMQSLASGLEAEVGDVLSVLGGLNATIPATLNQEIMASVGRKDGDDARIVLNLEYHAAPGDGTKTKEDVMAMLGHATELVREELD